MLASVAAVLLAVPAAAQTESVLYSFKAGHGDGNTPLSHILEQKGLLYGTSEKGGAYHLGAIFEVTRTKKAWSERLLYSFTGNGDGAFPKAGLTIDASGALYGTTQQGGENNTGTAFRLTSSGGGWSEEVIHSFGGSGDGTHPVADLNWDKTSGKLYGTTYDGGASNCGVVYQLALSGGVWSETVLATLGGTAGCNSQSTVRRDSFGNLYGTTVSGGQYGYGNVYLLTANNGTWTETDIHDFASGTDGAFGSGINLSTAGIVYGVTSAGGSSNDGVAFALAKSGKLWNETILHNFIGGTSDGSNPYGLHIDPNTGALYGSTVYGGSSNFGTVFELTQSGNTWSEALLHSFGGTPDGAYPEDELTLDPGSGALFGTTTEGGTGNSGAVFELVP